MMNLGQDLAAPRDQRLSQSSLRTAGLFWMAALPVALLGACTSERGASSSADSGLSTKDGGQHPDASSSHDGGKSEDGGVTCEVAIYQINAGGGSVGSFAGDELSDGGSIYNVSQLVDTNGVANAAPELVYQSYRYGFYGPFSYSFGPLTPGARYTVRLHFAEIYDTAVGDRLFNVTLNGAAILTSFDVFATAGGGWRALVEDFSAKADATGKILLTFSPIAGHDSSMVNGIELLQSKILPTCPTTSHGGGGDAGPVEASAGDASNPRGDGGAPDSAAGDGGAPSFAQIITGVRPRGQQCGAYSLSSPSGGGHAYYVSPTGSDSSSGTSSAPFQTINHAASIAGAGDVVTIEDGTYDESVTVTGSGTASAPIVFQAEHCGSAILGQTNSRSFAGAGSGNTNLTCSNQYVTLQGLVFRQYAAQAITGGQCQPSGSAVNPCGHWTIDNCLFDHPGSAGIHPYFDDVTISRTTIQYANGWSILGAGPGYCSEGSPGCTLSSSGSYVELMHNLTVRDCVFSNANYQGQATSSCSASLKVLYSEGTLVDNVESYDNIGPSWWFDFENHDWTITENYFHGNTGNASSDGYDGAGVVSEGPGSNGELAYNVFTNLTGPAVGMYETQGHTIHDNLMNGGGVSMRYGCHGNFVVSGLDFYRNQIIQAEVSENQPCSGTGPSAKPGGDDITANYDVFDRGGQPIWSWSSIQPTTPGQAFSELGVEQNATLATIVYPPQ